MEKPVPFLTTPVAILLSAFLISISILLHGGVIKIGNLTTGGTGVPTVAQPAQPAGQPAPVQPVDVEKLRTDDHVKGDRNARILLIEYSDFECPFCKRFHPTAQQALDQYKGQLAWVYRHFPLTQIHPKAQKLAEASECVYDQGGNDGFWKFTDAVFNDPEVPEIASLSALVGEFGFDQTKFKTCLDSGEKAAYISKDTQSGTAAGVSGTPGNILLDTKTGKTVSVPGAVPFEQLKSAIDSLLQS
jgi:protein-disulfide isomerase